MLSRPTTNIAEAGRVRKLLAAKVGGDQSFGRPAQVIRIAGSIYGKGGQTKPVQMLHASDATYDLGELVDAIESMEWMEGCLPSGAVALPLWDGSGPMDFSAGAGIDFNRIGAALTTDVHAGGTDGATRWDTFNAVAGHHIHCIRTGVETVEEARERTWGWVLEHMKPAWERQRFDAEWQGLLNHDVRDKGEIVPVEQGFGLPAAPEEIAGRKGIEPLETIEDMLSWAVAKRSSLEPAPRIDLVQDMIVAGQRHLLVSEGGAGKTFLCMDLMLKIAASRADYPTLFWLGQPLTEETHDATVVMFTAEDNQAALDRRWKQIDPDFKLRARAGDRLIVIPMDNIGGSFPLVMRKPHGGGDVQVTPEWAKMVRILHGLAAHGHKVKCVVIDTLNSTLHGEESSAEVIAQYMRALAPVTADLGAALIITHHVRKQQADRRVQDADAMLDAIRGSAAIKDNVRVAIGIWRTPDWQKRMRMMGLPPRDKHLYCAEIVKANEPMYPGTKYLLRTNGGLLDDCTKSLASAVDTVELEMKLWIRFAIEQYAEQGFFFTKGGDGSGIWIMKHLLHPMFHTGVTRDELMAVVDKMLRDRVIQTRKVDKAGSLKAVFFDLADAPDERIASEKGSQIEPLEYHLYRADLSALDVVPVEG